MRKYIIWFILFPAAVIYSLYRNAHDVEKEVDMNEMDIVADFIQWQHKETVILDAFCRRGNYQMQNMSSNFEQLFSAELRRVDGFIYSLQPFERLAFRKELNKVFNENKEIFLNDLQRSYEHSKRMAILSNEAYEVEDYCRYIDKNAQTWLIDAHERRLNEGRL